VAVWLRVQLPAGKTGKHKLYAVLALCSTRDHARRQSYGTV
jgi:hypothetical protein